MSYRISFRSDVPVGTIFLRGVVTAKTLGRALADLVSSCPWRHEFHTLWNGLAIDEVILTPEGLNDLVALSDRLQDEMGPGREAVVMAPDMSRTWAGLFARSHETALRQRRLFHATEPACMWLIEGGAGPPLKPSARSRQLAG